MHKNVLISIKYINNTENEHNDTLIHWYSKLFWHILMLVDVNTGVVVPTNVLVVGKVKVDGVVSVIQ